MKAKEIKDTHKHIQESNEEHVCNFLYGLLWGSACQKSAETLNSWQDMQG